MKKHPATVAILAGGRSSRMGRDKALLSYQGKPLIRHTVDTLSPAFDDVLVSADAPERFAFLGVPIVVDRIPDAGPLMALASVLAEAKHDVVVLVACDIANPDLVLLEELLPFAESVDGAIPVCDGRPQPLFAVYRKSRVGPQVEALIASGKRAMFDLLEAGDFATLPVDAIRIRNINTPDDYAALLEGNGG